MVKKVIIGLFSIILFQSCRTDVQVTYVGNLQSIMQGRDTSAKIDLETLADVPHVYAVGALENLGGEILVMDGKPYISNFKNALYVIDKSFDFKAALLIYSQVEEWNTIEIPESLWNMRALEIFISEIAGPYGLKGKLFPFFVEGKISKADWHVINGKAGENHQESGVNGVIENKWVRIVGFYSEEHQGIIIHHGTNIHAHIIDEDETMAGHLDYFTWEGPLTMKVPK